ncbi:MAG: diguanylate cyclase [Alphaproteobacteria bacterium]|nr:diguanylate cyclase [Alphaproteobacteria bacterium]
MGKKRSTDDTDDERRRRPRRLDDGILPNFRDMIEQSAQGILVHSNFKPLYANTAFADLLGFETPQAITDLPLIRSLFPQENWPQIEAQYNDFMRSDKTSQHARVQVLSQDGRDLWLTVIARKIDWDEQQAVHICAFDMTPNIKLEQLLLANEQKLRAILEILPVPLCITRRSDGRFLFVNRKLCFLLQQSAGPLLRSCAQDYLVDPQEWDKLHAMLDRVSDLHEIEVKVRSALGHAFTAEVAAITMNHEDQPALLIALNDVSARKKLEDELFHQANTDPLTSLSNRRFFMIQAEQEIRRARRFSRDLSLIMVDLDHFKNVNDTYGHATGDRALETLVRASFKSLRESDIMGRLGGEEFAIILPETSLEAAKDVALRLLAHVAQTEVPSEKGAFHMTTSLGVSALRPTDTGIDDLLNRADDALFAAKREGRNRVEVLA